MPKTIFGYNETDVADFEETPHVVNILLWAGALVSITKNPACGNGGHSSVECLDHEALKAIGWTQAAKGKYS